MSKVRLIGLIGGPTLAALVYLLLPAAELDPSGELIGGLSHAGRSVGALLVLMATWWVTEAIPIPATALLPVALLPLLSGGEISIRSEEPFLVLATQNPIEQEGTYPLPEAQVDRFMLKIRVGYPSVDDERKIIDRMANGREEPEVRKVTDAAAILGVRRTVDEVFVDEKVRDYVVDLVHATRDPAGSGIGELDGMVEMGASPRASIYLTRAAKAHAFLQGRTYATPHDVKTIALDVLRHRVILTYEAEAEGKTPEDIVERILVGILVP